MARRLHDARTALAVTLAAWAGLVSAPASATETEDELRDQLAAQEQVNQLLMQRIETLEAELEGRRLSAPQSSAESPKTEPEDEAEADALDRTFVRRGLAVLPGGRFELAPTLLWGHSDSTASNPGQDLFGAVLDGRIGIAGGWMAGASLPVIHRAIGSGGGHASGIGDVSATLWKSLLSQNGKRPSLVASLRYSAPTGGNASTDLIPLGSGFHQATLGLASAKTIAPIAFTGSVRYTTVIGDSFRGVDVDRRDIYGAAIGANLAVTPDISVSTNFDFAFGGAQRVNGVKIDGTGEAQALLELGVGTVVARNTLLVFGGAIGISGDNPDFAMSVSLPVRF